jgi:hypothetical protein
MEPATSLKYHEKFNTLELETKADAIMLSFNIEKVHQHMLDTDWRWSGDDGTMEVPTVDRLKSLARSLLTQAIWDYSLVTNVGTGGFTAYKLPWGLSLTFQIQWSHA